MIQPGEYAWRNNNRYGDNHRVLTLTGAAGIQSFSLVVIHSAGGQGKDFSVTTGSARVEGPDRLELVAKQIEHVTTDSDTDSRVVPCDQRMLFVARKTWWGWRTQYFLDGEAFVPRG